MQVIKYIKENGIESLTTDLSIKVKEYPEGLIVLNYDQIASPKSHPIVMECRGLILDKDYNVVSRSFDRFFNLGEVPESQSHVDMAKAVCLDKIDGSLIRLYYWNNQWQIATRGTAFAESDVNGFGITFKDLVIKALGENHSKLVDILDPDVTYICEITSMENRVVTRYEGYTLYFLAARHNKTFDFVTEQHKDVAISLGMELPKVYKFDTKEACVETANTLKNLAEGYVLYQDGVPVCKIKSPAYCAVHLIKGEGLNPKRIAELVCTGETSEYLTYFPEDSQHIIPYVEKLEQFMVDAEDLWCKAKNIESQKDFAMMVKDFCGSAVMFYLRKNPSGSIKSAFSKQTESYRVKLLLSLMGGV
jgi:T4 RnlA family RNA ligase